MPTTNLGLTLPTDGADLDTWGTELNTALTAIDTVFSKSGTAVAMNLIGTTTNDSAGSGKVGEYTSSTIASGSAVSLTNNTPANLTSLSLTAGDWEVSLVARFTGDASTTVTRLIGAISATSATLDGVNDHVGDFPGNAATIFTSADPTVAVPQARFLLASTTTIYAVAQAGFAVSTCSVYGVLKARRIR